MLPIINPVHTNHIIKEIYRTYQSKYYESSTTMYIYVGSSIELKRTLYIPTIHTHEEYHIAASLSTHNAIHIQTLCI